MAATDGGVPDPFGAPAAEAPAAGAEPAAAPAAASAAAEPVQPTGADVVAAVQGGVTSQPVLVVADTNEPISPFGGSVMMSGSDMSSGEFPIIPIRPNAAIPVTIGILFLIAGVLVAGSGALTIFGGTQDRTDEYYENQHQGFELLGVDVTEEEVREWDQAFLDANFYGITGALSLLAGLAMLAGGLLLVLRLKLGVWLSLGAAVGWLVFGIAGTFWAGSIEADVGVSLETSFDIALTGISYLCNLLCIVAPLLPWFLASGRAALR